MNNIFSPLHCFVIHRSLSHTSCTSTEQETKPKARSFRKHHKKRRTDCKHFRKPRRMFQENEDGMESLKNTGSMRRNAPRYNSSLRCFEPSPFSFTTERLSQPRQVSQTPDLKNGHLWDCPHEYPAGMSCLCFHKLEVDFPSTVESHSTLSDRLETNSPYIYAESIKGFDSWSTFIADSDTHNPNSISVLDSFDRLSQDFEYLYISGTSSSDLSACSIHAMEGSRYSGTFETLMDLDSACIYTDYGCSIAEAEWGSASSQSSYSSCCTTDRDSESSYCTINRQTHSSESSSSVSSVHGLEKVYFDSLDKHKRSFDSDDALKSDTVEDVPRDAEDQMISQSCSCYMQELRDMEGVVIQSERYKFLDVFCEMIKEAKQEKVVERRMINEGFLFHPKQV